MPTSRDVLPISKNSNASLNWWLALRPKTLSATVVPVLVGTALAKSSGQPLVGWVSVLSLFGALGIQIATNLFNDAIDFRKGADTSDRIGPKRVTHSGLLSSKQVMAGAIACLAFAAVCGGPLVLRGGWPLLAVGLISMALAYGYTGGPFPLAYLGLGDLFVLIFFGVVAVGGTAHLHHLDFRLEYLVGGLQVGCGATVLIAINNYRDMFQDVLAGKKTLAVRFGAKFVKAEILGLLSLAYALGIFWWQSGFRFAAILPLFSLPLTIKVIVGVWKTSPSPALNGYLARSSLLHVFFGLLLSLGLFLR